MADGITINGLTILNEWPTLDTYFESNVVGGTGHFVIPANDYEAYGEAIFRKLLREITGPGITDFLNGEKASRLTVHGQPLSGREFVVTEHHHEKLYPEPHS